MYLSAEISTVPGDREPTTKSPLSLLYIRYSPEGKPQVLYSSNTILLKTIEYEILMSWRDMKIF